MNYKKVIGLVLPGIIALAIVVGFGTYIRKNELHGQLKKISIAKGLHPLTAINDKSKVLGKSLESDFVILSFLDASCSECIAELENWEKFADEVHNSNVSYVFVAYNTSFELLDYTINDLSGFKLPTFFDPNNSIMSENQIFTSEIKTFLLDKNGNIIRDGNPAKHPEYYQSYLEALN